MFKKKGRLGADPMIVILPLLLCGIGLLVLYSAAQYITIARGIDYSTRQAVWMAVGFAVAFIISRIDYRRILDWSYLFYGLAVFALILLLLVGGARMGARRWLAIGGIAFQPSEFTKIALILITAYFLGNNRYGLKNIRACVIPLVILAVPFLLIAKQPDLGSAIVLVPMLLAMLYAAGVRARYVLFIIAGGLASAPLFWNLLKDYQKTRLLVFTNPNLDPLGAGYTIIQSKIAIGSGGLWGKGWMSGTQNQLNFLPERHTDFIFSVVGEEWGFAGSAIVILLFILFFKHALAVAQRTNDVYGRIIVTGATVMLAFQAVVNIGMTVGLMPVVGLPLPFITAGGSSLLTACTCVGLILSVDMHRTTF